MLAKQVLPLFIFKKKHIDTQAGEWNIRATNNLAKGPNRTDNCDDFVTTSLLLKDIKFASVEIPRDAGDLWKSPLRLCEEESIDFYMLLGSSLNCLVVLWIIKSLNCLAHIINAHIINGN